jgi:predicted RNase H-like HicB family nuclease
LFVISISGLDGSLIDDAMIHYVAIVEDAGTEKAIGIWFPDLPGCFSAGDDVDDALRNAHEALALYAEAEAQEGRALPKPRSITALRSDPSVIPDLRDHMVALVALDSRTVHAAE